MRFQVYGFADRQEKRGEVLHTGAITAHGHPWKLGIYPRGITTPSTVSSRICSIYLCLDEYIECDESITTKFTIRTKTTSNSTKSDFTNKEWEIGCGWSNFSERDRLIRDDCDEDGTLVIDVDIEVATAKNPVWYPKTKGNNDIGSALYESPDFSDVTINAGRNGKEFKLHKCVLALGAKALCELVQNESIVDLPDVDALAFEEIMKFIYTGNKPDVSNNEERAISILLLADRFECNPLKLYIESVITEKLLKPSNAAALLLFADSHSCPLLKEACMEAYANDPQSVMESKDGWQNVVESNKILAELLTFATMGRKQYIPITTTGDLVESVNDMNITSLRERLDSANLDVDGSHKILVERWKQHLRKK
eukprot:CAMPEP_0178918702 /NCGR_PEP_ID=MMETSP0786-20121207/13970_1 /TAXON_ID=186022 /ORGANISM="Thalassionema frauenfeldii, Strain CCMP 1798" /LENGTH=367 /DNA_ID=CAMNT_0020592435 /DNA_START=104 /DNA_END=1207 /DNA_ORIENTATION=+